MKLSGLAESLAGVGRDYVSGFKRGAEFQTEASSDIAVYRAGLGGMSGVRGLFHLLGVACGEIANVATLGHLERRSFKEAVYGGGDISYSGESVIDFIERYEAMYGLTEDESTENSRENGDENVSIPSIKRRFYVGENGAVGRYEAEGQIREGGREPVVILDKVKERVAKYAEGGDDSCLSFADIIRRGWDKYIRENGVEAGKKAMGEFNAAQEERAKKIARGEPVEGYSGFSKFRAAYRKAVSGKKEDHERDPAEGLSDEDAVKKYWKDACNEINDVRDRVAKARGYQTELDRYRAKVISDWKEEKEKEMLSKNRINDVEFAEKQAYIVEEIKARPFFKNTSYETLSNLAETLYRSINVHEDGLERNLKWIAENDFNGSGFRVEDGFLDSVGVPYVPSGLMTEVPTKDREFNDEEKADLQDRIESIYYRIATN